ncbi:MAG: DUF106 domain-containing protein [Candidatus Methanomethylophilaceae archaeon]|nr:DUF106 domain-containing protein [Candidatus Methanomethylophilaceae archaeon]MBQ9690331.1 DUF106 domain-containing protein [Candidatus Methanomethylophilaceae archaeon]
MANPGTPGNVQAPAMNNTSMTRMLITMLVIMAVSMITVQFRMEIGGALDVVFGVLAFKDHPMISIMLVCTIAILITTVIRSFMQDPLKTARNQQIQSDFNRELRQARIENNLFKMKKLEEMQPQMMEASMQQSSEMMKVMPFTMVIFIPIIAWAWYFVNTGTVDDPGAYFSPTDRPIIELPWCGNVDLTGSVFLSMPLWLILYMMVTLPIGQVENRLIRLYLLKKELKRLDAEAQRAEIE